MDVEKHRDLLTSSTTASTSRCCLPPGCVNVARYRTVAGEPRYLAAYEVDRTDPPMSKPGTTSSDIGRQPEVRPYTYNKHLHRRRAHLAAALTREASAALGAGRSRRVR